MLRWQQIPCTANRNGGIPININRLNNSGIVIILFTLCIVIRTRSIVIISCCCCRISESYNDFIIMIHYICITCDRIRFAYSSKDSFRKWIQVIWIMVHFFLRLFIILHYVMPLHATTTSFEIPYCIQYLVCIHTV